MHHGALSEQIREKAVERFVKPAIAGGESRFSIEVKALIGELESEGFPPNHPAQFCSALQTKKFLDQHGLEIDRVDGPPSKKSTTVVLHYRIKSHPSRTVMSEDPAAWAKRLTDRLRGLLKEELAAYGGAEGFIRWTRDEDDERA